MFLGHFGLAFAAKKIVPQPSLGTTFMAAQFIDLLWPLFLLAGWEEVAIDPGNTVFTPLNFISYPYSHSLMATVIWGLLFGILAYFGYRKNRKAAIMLGLLVVSHWLLDFVTHRPDLPLTLNNTSKHGLGLWNNLYGTIAVELFIFITGCLLYLRSTQAKNKWGTISFISLVVFFLAIYFMNVFGDPPPNEEVIGYVGLAQWLFIAWGYWVDGSRRSTSEIRTDAKKDLE